MRQLEQDTIRANSHYILSCLLLLASIPALRAVGLPASVSWGKLVPLYWVGFTLRSVVAAAMLAAIGLPSETVAPLWRQFKRRKIRFIFLVPFVFWAFWKLGVDLAIVWTSLIVVSMELLDRSYENPAAVSRSIKRVIPPALYLFFGLVLVFAYNDVIVATRKPDAYDWLFLKADSYLLRGTSISAMVQIASAHFSSRIFDFAEAIYYTMFEQVGATLVIISICQGTKRGLRFVGTLLTAYYFALLIFYLWPSMGPFYTCVGHFTHFPHWLKTYANQRNIIAHANVLSGAFRSQSQIATDYFIAFPSLHAADPIIVLWFFRKWKRITYCLIAHDILLIPSILLLEWHYAVDLIGGVLVAAIAIWLNNPRNEELEIKEPADALRSVLETEQVAVIA